MTRTKGPIRVLLWGADTNFRRNLPYLRERERNGEIRVVGVVDRTLPDGDTIAGWPYVPPAAVPKQEYDYLQILPTEFRDEIREQYLNMTGSDPRKLLIFAYPELSIPDYLHIVRSRPSIFTPLCWGGLVCSYLGMECLSPFKNLWLMDEDFLRFLRDPRGYIAEDPVPDHMKEAISRYDRPRYPVLRLGDILLYCNHYDSMETAIADWKRRREKINWENTIAVFPTMRPRMEKEFWRLNTVSRRICFVPYTTKEAPSMTIPPLPGKDGLVEWKTQINSMSFPSRNPFDIYSALFGELKQNRCFDPDALE